jgi:imidazolonepropionase-like amidohydrolase
VIFIDLSGHAAKSFGGSRSAQWALIEQAFDESLESDADDRELLSAAGARALKETRRAGTFVFHVNRAADIIRLIDFAKAQKINAVVHGGREAWIVADQLNEADIPVVLNALDNLPADFDSLGSRLDNAALLDQSGVTVMFSSRETHNARKVRQLAGNAVANGLSHEVAIQAMTTTPAKIFGGESRLATVGAKADFVVWSGDPLDVTSLAEAVVIGGIPDPMTSRQTQLRDRYLPAETDLPRSYIKP